MGDEVHLLPAAVQGPDPFTGSTVTAPTVSGTGSAGPTASPHAGAAEPTAAGPPVAGSSPPALAAGLVAVPPRPMRVLSGTTPGLYGGSARVAGCDVERQIGYLRADRAKGDAFARASGVSASGVPGYLRGLAPVMLRADTRVTDHGYRGGQAVGYQAVLQAGTAVLVDDRGLPRVRCACGNPLGAPAPTAGFSARGSAWSGYRPGRVIAVTPAPRAVASITIVNSETRTWIERRIGHDVRHDRVVPAPDWATAPPDGDPDPADTASPGTAPPYSLPSPQRSGPGTSPGPSGGQSTAATLTGPDTPAGRGAPVPGTADPSSSSLGLVPDVLGGQDPPYGFGPADGIGPPAVPDTAGPPGRGGPLPDGTPDVRSSAVPDATDGDVAADLSGG